MNQNIFRATLAVSVAALALTSVANGQSLGRATQPDWTNAGGDAQRTNWQRTDQAINVSTAGGEKFNYSSPSQMSGFGLQIRRRIDNVSRGYTSLSGGVTLSDANLGENRVLFTGSDNRVIAFDPDIGRPTANRKLDGVNPAGTLTCPGASVATPARPANLTIAATPVANNIGQPSGRGNPGTFVAAPGEGLPNQRAPGARSINPPGIVLPPPPPPAAGAAPGGRAGAPAAPGAPAAGAAPGAAAGGAAAAPGRAGAAPAAPGAPGAAPGGAAAAPGGRGGGAATPPVRNLNVGIGAAAVNGGGFPNGGFGSNGTGSLYVISNDGRLRHMTYFMAYEGVQPTPFLRPGAQPTDLIALSNVLYTSTVNGCGGQANGVYSITVTQAPRGPGTQIGAAAAAGRGGAAPAPAAGAPPAPPPPPPPPPPVVGTIKSWTTGGTSNPSGVSFVGPAPAPPPAAAAAPAAGGGGFGGGGGGRGGGGAAAGPPPTTGLVATSAGTGQYANSVVALNPADLTVKSVFTLAGADFVTTPVIFRDGDNAFAAVQARDGRIFVFNAENLQRPLLVTAAVAGMGGYEAADMAYWQETGGQRWLLTTTANSVVAHRIGLNGQTVTLTQGWTLGDLKAPISPIIVNGVVFAASSGQFIPAAGANPALAARVRGSTPARLYALEGSTGRRLWDSGTSITSFIPQGAKLWSTMGQVMVGTYDNYMYAFGTNMERHSNQSIELGM